MIFRPGHPPADYLIGHATAVLPDRIIEDAVIVVRDHRIAEIAPATGRALEIDVDAEGLTVTPGLIDTHTDALEKERMPRAGTDVPVDFALGSLEGRLRGAGITTVYHGTGFRHQSVRGVLRSVDRALEEAATIDAAAPGLVEHRVLHRLDILSDQGAATLKKRLDALDTASAPALVSFEDHTPGQGQYPDEARLRSFMIDNEGHTPEEADHALVRMKAAAEEGSHIRERTEQWLAGLAAAGKVRLLAHDPDCAEVLDRFQGYGGEVAEFPTTLAAARHAREIGLIIVGGGPNALRGKSHSGNVSAADLAAEGLIDALTSDYMPSALLGGVRNLFDQGHLDLPSAVSLVTAGPARVAGLTDRGRLAEGLLADFAFLDFGQRWPRVLSTHKAWPA